MTTEATRQNHPLHKICGCVVTCGGDREHEPRITYCPTHAAAREMVDGLRHIADAEPEIDRFKEFGVARQLQDALMLIAAIKQTAAALLRRIEGGPDG